MDNTVRTDCRTAGFASVARRHGKFFRNPFFSVLSAKSVYKKANENE